MKTLVFFVGFMAANPINFFLLNEVFDENESSSDDYLKMMLLSPSLLGKSQTQACQMDPMLPYLFMNNGGNENSKIIMMMMLQNPNISMENILPYIMFENGKVDMQSLFLLTTVIQNNCNNTNDQLNMLLPLLLLKNEDEDKRKRRETEESAFKQELKMLLLMQTMSEGNNGLDINLITPYLVMKDEMESNDDVNLLLMVLMNSVSSEMDSEDGFRDNFNLLLPLLLESDNASDNSDMLFILMAMQSQAPGTNVSSNTLLPLLLMETQSNNELLIFFMAMINNKKCEQPAEKETAVIQNERIQKSGWISQEPLVLEPIQLPIKPIKTVDPPIETDYRTRKVNLDASRTVINSNDGYSGNQNYAQLQIPFIYEGSGY